jgi:hypothetical protein
MNDLGSWQVGRGGRVEESYWLGDWEADDSRRNDGMFNHPPHPHRVTSNIAISLPYSPNFQPRSHSTLLRTIFGGGGNLFGLRTVRTSMHEALRVGERLEEPRENL